MSLRRRIFNLLGANTLAGKLTIGTIMTLILANALAVIMESVEPVQLANVTFFWQFEVFSVAVFTVEYLLRVWTAVENEAYRHPLTGRLRFMLTPMALIDLMAILPFYLPMVFMGFDARFLRVVRLLRVFKLTRHLKALEVLTTVVRNEAGALMAAILILGVMVVIASGGIYVAERESQSEAFGSIPNAMWWAIVTLSTVGYGDVVPTTVAGKLFGVLVMVIGVGMAALPAGIIAAGFSAEMHRRREAFRLKVHQVLDDGAITTDERHELSRLREDLGLLESEADTMAETESLRGGRDYDDPRKQCPHCGKSISG